MKVVGFRFFLLVFIVLIPLTSFAIVTSDVCGDELQGDTEGSNTYCTGTKDEDRDGYCKAGEIGCTRSGTDCDDNDARIFPDQSTNATCSADQYRECQSSGSYGSCSNLSAYTCHTGSGATYWFSTSGNNSNAGTYAAPFRDTEVISNSGHANYQDPSSGDCFVFRGGTYVAATWDDSGTTRMFYFNNKDGTVTNPINIKSAPGETALFEVAGTSPTEVWPFYVLNSDYVNFKDLEINGSTGYSNNGIFYSGSSYGIVTNVYIRDVDGESDNNLGAIKFSNLSVGWIVQNSRFEDNYERSSPTLANNSGSIISFESQDAIFRNNIVWCTRSGGCGEGIRFNKHGGVSYDLSTVSDNVVHNFDQPGITTTGSNLLVTRNYMEDVGASLVAITYVINDTNKYGFEDVIISNNTIVDSGFFEFTRNSVDDPVFSKPALTVEDNVVIDDESSYAADGTSGFIRVGHYGSNQQKSSVDVSGVFITRDNCYYNNSASIFMSYFGDNTAAQTPDRDEGATYSGLSAIQTAGFESGTVHVDPALDSKSNATHVSCIGKGAYLALSGEGSGSNHGGVSPLEL